MATKEPTAAVAFVADLAEGAAARRVKEPVPERIADPRPQRSEPGEPLRVARRQRSAERREARRRAPAAEPAPLEVRFEPEDPRTRLPVVAGLAAPDDALKRRVEGRKPKSSDSEGVAARAEGAADIEPGVKAGPERLGFEGRQLRRRRQVGCARGAPERKQRQSGRRICGASEFPLAPKLRAGGLKVCKYG